MYIGSLINGDAGIAFTYGYRRMNSSIRYCPDWKKEAVEKEFYDVDGQLVRNMVGFYGPDLLDNAVDILLCFGRKCFIDSISFVQDKDSAISKIQVFSVERQTWKPVARHLPESGKNITTQEITLSVGVEAESLVLRVMGAYQHMVLGKLDVFGAIGLEEALYPIPQRLKRTGKVFREITGIEVGEGTEFAAQNFVEKYQDLFGREIPQGKGNIYLSINPEMEYEAYTVSITETEVRLRGGSSRAMLYATEKLLQLCTADGIVTAEIEDKPFLAMRGVHFGLPNRKNIEFLKRMVKYVFMPMGYNMVIIEIAGGMEYKRHPEINAMWEEKGRLFKEGKGPYPPHYGIAGCGDILNHEEVRDLCDWFRKYGLEVVPEVQTFGHTEYITMSHPEMAEIVEVDNDENVDLYVNDAKLGQDFYHSMCPNHPDYYQLTFDIIDEVIEVFQPERYVHIGHDEIEEVGKCPICKKIGAAKVYAQEVTALHDHLKELGYGTMMWSDMLDEPGYDTLSAIHMIPKDIICLSFTWYFHLDTTENCESRLIENGFHYMIGNFYSSHFPRFTERRNGEGLVGAQVSTWVACNEMTWGYEGKMYDFVYSANMLWSKRHVERMRNTYDRLVSRNIARIREYIREDTFVRYEKEPLSFEKKSEHVPYELGDFYAGAAAADNNCNVTVKVEKKVDRLSFLHATDIAEKRAPWQGLQKMGSYMVTYDDGMECVIGIFYGANICVYNRKYALPLESSLYRHEGYIGTYAAEPWRHKGKDGEDCVLYEYTWNNPHPEKKIDKIELTVTSGRGAKVLLFEVYGNREIS